MSDIATSMTMPVRHAAAMVGKRLRYKDLTADNGLSSGARS